MQGLWLSVFGNECPVEVEIGAGTGTFLLSSATENPGVNFFGIERSGRLVRTTQAAIDAHGLSNARIVAADAACVVANIIPLESVSAYHVYFPDPWWKRRHHRRRLFTPPFVDALARTLAPGGFLHVATDVDETFALMLRTVRGTLAFTRESPASSRPHITRFERKARARGTPIRESTFVKRPLSSASQRAHTRSAAPMTPAESPS